VFDVRRTPGASSKSYLVFKSSAALYVQKMMPDGIVFVLTSSNERGGTWVMRLLIGPFAFPFVFGF
jgi:hypothetical protein